MVQQQLILLLFILHGVSFLFSFNHFSCVIPLIDLPSYSPFFFFFTRNVLPKNESAKVPQCVL